jgi:HEAT repeat protein
MDTGIDTGFRLTAVEKAMNERREQIEGFLAELQSPDAPTRFAAVACLGGLKAVEAIRFLMKVICDESEDELIRLRAVAALGEIGRPASESVETIMSHYAEGYREIFCEALRAIGTNEAIAFAKAREANHQ